METFSNSVSTTTTLQVPNPLTPTHHRRPHHHLRPTTVKPAVASSSISQSKPKPTFRHKDNFTPLHFPNYSHKPPPPRPTLHRRASTGYAAALLEVAQWNGAVLEVARDVRRLLKLLNNEEFQAFMEDQVVEEKAKGEAMKELMEKGKFEGHLVGLIKLVIQKGKRVSIVKEVLEEFHAIFYQLTPSAYNTLHA